MYYKAEADKIVEMFMPSARYIREIQIEKGTYNLYEGLTPVLFSWVLFILSIYYK